MVLSYTRSMIAAVMDLVQHMLGFDRPIGIIQVSLGGDGRMIFPETIVLLRGQDM